MSNSEPSRDQIVYIAGPYSNGNTEDNTAREKNVERARRAAVEYWQRGFTVICPHLNTYNFDIEHSITYEAILEGDLEIIRRLRLGQDKVVMLAGWVDSEGASLEHEEARNLGLKVEYY